MAGLYRGLSAAIPSIFIYRGLYFGIYDAGKELIIGENARITIRFVWAQAAVVFS